MRGPTAIAMPKLGMTMREGTVLERRIYQGRACAGCPLRGSCTDRKRNRRLRSNGRNPLREAMAEKVHSPEGRRIYRQRQAVAESPFGILKRVMGVRQFLLRGLEKVRVEWRWACTAYNLRILATWVRQQRARWTGKRRAGGALA